VPKISISDGLFLINDYQVSTKAAGDARLQANFNPLGAESGAYPDGLAPPGATEGHQRLSTCLWCYNDAGSGPLHMGG
jgi:hypothetical protein